jgi:hypothetical protein
MLVLGFSERRPIEIVAPDGTKILIKKLPNVGSGPQVGIDAPAAYRIVSLKTAAPQPKPLPASE